MTCIAPSLVLTPDAASSLGLTAEAVIAQKYKTDMGRPAFFPMAPSIDFFDISHGFGNTSLYAAFLGAHHPSMTPSMLLSLSDDKLLKIPDLMTFAPPTQTEFYEIKPNSPSGRVAGSAKVASVSALYSRFSLPYRAGEIWTPDFKFILFSGSIFAIKVDVFLHIFRSAPGLISTRSVPRAKPGH